jgi:hypothetical protein
MRTHGAEGISATRRRHFDGLGSACLAVVLLLCEGCAGGFDPLPVREVGLLDRVVMQEKDGVRVRTAVPSRKETKAIFSSDLYRKGVQPVWLEIANDRDEVVSFLPVGLDPEYFTPLEAANLDLEGDTSESDKRINKYFFDNSMSHNILAGQTRSGFVFTSLDEGTKSFNVDIVGRDDVFSFTFFVPVPGIKVDHESVDWENLYPPDEYREVDAESLVAALEELPCCTRDKKGEDEGDPLNLVVVGDPEDVYYAFIRAGWDETEKIYRGSLWKTMTSFISGGEYRYSPVSGLFVFGRSQDVAFQKARSNIHERNHLRLWLSPLLFEGKSVWMGQISRDIGVRFTKRTITTHKIDPNVDETREYLLENLAYSQALAKFTYVRGVGEAPISAPRGNLTGDPYFTDGYRVVLFVTSIPVDIADIETADWRIPPYRRDD